MFRAPWEAQAFAMAVKLHERGVFTWPEWAEALGAEIAAAGAGDDGEDYYLHWMSALEKLAAAKGVVNSAEFQTARMPGTGPPAPRPMANRSSLGARPDRTHLPDIEL